MVNGHGVPTPVQPRYRNINIPQAAKEAEEPHQKNNPRQVSNVPWHLCATAENKTALQNASLL